MLAMNEITTIFPPLNISESMAAGRPTRKTGINTSLSALKEKPFMLTGPGRNVTFTKRIDADVILAQSTAQDAPTIPQPRTIMVTAHTAKFTTFEIRAATIGVRLSPVARSAPAHIENTAMKG